MLSRTRTSIVSALAIASIAACGDDATGPDASSAAIQGSIENTTQTASSSARTASSRHDPAASAGSAQASTVAVAAVEADGSLEVLAEAQVEADGRFTIEDVPTGRSDLVVSARGSSGEEVGRVLVHGETRGGATTTTEPVNAETTVEGLVYGEVVASGADADVRSTATTSLLIRMDESTAVDVAVSGNAIQEVATAYRAGAESLAEGFAEVGVDGVLRSEAMVEAAAGHARVRDGGAGAEAAHEAFVEASLDVFADAGIGLEAVVLATGAAATRIDRGSTVLDAEARLDLVRTSVELNLAARERLVAEQPSSDERSAAASAVAEARVDVRAAASVSELAAVLVETEETAEEEITAAILAGLPSTIDAAVVTQVETLIGEAFAEADLSARLSGTVGIGPILDLAFEIRDRVRTRVQAVVEALPDGVELNVEATAGLMIAACGGPDVDS